MSLWIWYCPGTDAQISAACSEAQKVLDDRGVSARIAQQATFDAADLPADHTEESTPENTAVCAWFAAEEAAFKALHALTDEYPHQASLICTEDSN